MGSSPIITAKSRDSVMVNTLKKAVQNYQRPQEEDQGKAVQKDRVCERSLDEKKHHWHCGFVEWRAENDE